MATADLVFQNANVITLDPALPGARLVATRGNRILLVGNSRSLESIRGSGTRIIDCQGKTLVPGFNDAHCHIFSLIRNLLSIDLSPTAVSSIGDIKKAISRQAKGTPKGKWLLGNGYNEFYLAEKRHPTRRDLDEVAPDHPTVLSHHSLHACVLNSRALEMANINRETPEPPGTLIERDLSSGEPNGVLFEMLGYLREKVMPPLTETELERGIKLANQYYLSLGITSLQEATATNDLKRWQTYRRHKENGGLKSRIYLMPGIQALNQFREAGLTTGSGDNQLRLGCAKIMLSEASGRLYPPQPELNRQVTGAHRAGFPVAIHAVPESAIAAATTALENVRRQPPRPGLHHRLEHCAECPPPLLERLRKLKPLIVTQPPFLHYSGDRYLATVATATLPWLYRLRSLLDSGLTVAASSDSPIVPADPLVGIYAAVTRKTSSGQQLAPEERITVEEALAMYTRSAARASFEEDSKGSITAGKLADMVLLSDDPTKSPPERIKESRVKMTVIDGEVVWED